MTDSRFVHMSDEGLVSLAPPDLADRLRGLPVPEAMRIAASAASSSAERHPGTWPLVQQEIARRVALTRDVND